MGSRTGRALTSNDIIAGNGTALKNVYVGTPGTLSPYSFHIGVTQLGGLVTEGPTRV